MAETGNQDTYAGRVAIALLLLRIGVFIVMAMWTLDKFVNPDHTAQVFAAFYFTPGLNATAAYAIGALQAVLVLAFACGYAKRLSYGSVLAMHLVSTVSSWGRYVDPWTAPNLLFFAAWPMLAALIALYLLREADVLFTVGEDLPD
ncbi:MAG: DoxX family membrane protein [Gammaproteobacteria bacterium]|nr:DoxX family membrane protein [Gammaproteobacteria bacterium]